MQLALPVLYMSSCCEKQSPAEPEPPKTSISLPQRRAAVWKKDGYGALETDRERERGGEREGVRASN